jgi:hypothetical protein
MRLFILIKSDKWGKGAEELTLRYTAFQMVQKRITVIKLVTKSIAYKS